MNWIEVIPHYYEAGRYRAICLAQFDGRWALTFDGEQIGSPNGYKTLKLAQAAAGKHLTLEEHELAKATD